MEKKLYYELEDNSDLCVTCSELKECFDIIETHLSDMSDNDKKYTEYSIRPKFLTDKEFEELGEWEG